MWRVWGRWAGWRAGSLAEQGCEDKVQVTCAEAWMEDIKVDLGREAGLRGAKPGVGGAAAGRYSLYQTGG